MDDMSLLHADLPTMVVRCNNTLLLRSVITGQQIEVLGPAACWKERPIPTALMKRNEQIEREFTKALEAVISLMPNELPQKRAAPAKRSVPVKTECRNDAEGLVQLPPCKVQRNYSCSICSFCTQNPRSHLLHQRDVHGVRLSIHSCQYCQYASRYCQKLKRHVKMVHSGDPGAKTEKPNDAVGRQGERKESIDKPTELPLSSESVPQTSQEPTEIEMKPEIEVEPAKCSKPLSIPQPQPTVNIKSDPEAFFVSAYKNELNQFEKERRLTMLEIPPVPEQLVEASPSTDNPPGSLNTETPLTTRPEYHQAAVNAEHVKKPLYCCRKCNYMTHIKSRYNKHVKYHSMPMIQCHICEFRTTYKWNLTRHLRNHFGNGIYKCSICSFSANMKQSLSSHEFNHHSPPVGLTTARNKFIRKRRCRVGGSDLQPACNIIPSQKDMTNARAQQSVTSSDFNESERIENEDNTAQDLSMSNRMNNNSNENYLNNSRGSFPYSHSMDTSGMESSNFESSESSDMETSDIDSSNSSLQPNSSTAKPVHIDADYLNDHPKMNPNHSNNNQPSLLSIDTANTSMQCLDLRTKFKNSDRCSSSSTLSADESSHKNSENVFSSSSQSPKRSGQNVSSNSTSSSSSSSPSLSSSPPSPGQLCIWTSDDDDFGDGSQEMNVQGV